MASLPDEVWTEVLLAGVGAGTLDYRDLCSLSIASRSLNRLSSHNSIWRPLIDRDFRCKVLAAAGASATRESNCKAEYKTRFEKIKAAKVAARRREVLRLQSDCAAFEKECKELDNHMHREKSKLSIIFSELKQLEQARISSVALRIWQPERVRLMQQQVVEQQPIDPQFRQISLDMEAKVCRQEIRTCNRRLDKIRQALTKANRDLECLTYDPLQVLQDDVKQNRSKKKQKTKQHSMEKQSR